MIDLISDLVMGQVSICNWLFYEMAIKSKKNITVILKHDEHVSHWLRVFDWPAAVKNSLIDSAVNGCGYFIY